MCIGRLKQELTLQPDQLDSSLLPCRWKALACVRMSDYANLRPAISHYEAKCRNKFGQGFVGAANAHFTELQNKYYSKSDNPDYSSKLNKFCYLFKYSVAHGYYVFHSLKRARVTIGKELFSSSGMRIACIGGGPGSEIIGVLRYIREIEPQNRSIPIEIVVFDKEPTWEKVCTRVLECMPSASNVSVKFVEMDATNPSSYAPIDFSVFGIVISSFFMSETRKLRIATAARPFWKAMLGTMQKGAWLVALDFADNDGLNWNYLSSVIGSAGRPFVDIISDSAVGMSCPDSKAAILALETELDHRPKKNATNLVRVMAAV